ncbi:MAG: hypothetical protein ACLPVY_21870 [Acidimicrobiia bacterium]
MTLYEHIPHPRIKEREASGPVTVADQMPTATPAARLNSWLAVKITSGVGTMWCAYAFAAIALISLPDALKSGTAAIISWIAQTFLQLVLLSIIIVGQNIQSTASDKRAADTYKDAEAVLHEALEIQAHLMAQDAAIENILTHLGLAIPPPPAPAS